MNEIDLTKVDFEKPFMAGLMDGMPGGFFVYRGDETKKIIYANQKLLDIFDCDTWDEFVELTGGTFIGMVYARDRMIVHDYVRRARESGRTSGVTNYRIHTKKGVFKYVQNYANFVNDYVEGRLVYVFIAAARSTHDRLTGLPSMLNFLDYANSPKNEIFRSGKIPAMVAFDFFGFKVYNTRYGIQEGNKLLVEFSIILKDIFGKNSVSRFGEDHFYVLTCAGGIRERLDEVFERLSKANHGRTVPVRSGVYIYDMDDAVSASEACDRAKMACDVDRHSYMSFYNIFDKNLLEKERTRSFVLLNIGDALKNHEIEVYYQPQVDARTGKLCGAEGLARWNSPKAGLMMPGKFIPVLEAANLTYKLDICIIRQIARDFRKCIEEGTPIVPVSFNFSRTDFETCNPYEELQKAVKEYNLEPKMFRVEITESTLMSDPAKIKEQMTLFRKAGYEVLMDDFGSAYSSLATLRDFDFDEIKIDMGFMRNFSDKSKKIIRPMIMLAQSLDVHTLTEGVETAEQLSFLQQAGCERIQGYYFSKPIPYSEFVQKLKTMDCCDDLKDCEK